MVWELTTGRPVCRFEKAALEYQDQLSAVTGMDCSIKTSDCCLLKLSSNMSSPKHTTNGNRCVMTRHGTSSTGRICTVVSLLKVEVVN